ncbi:GlxA family transcriptional regulator [Taklimakanibacter lacteus]|uniref:GlxA family transcriptional regulator n=1 Tax=Taklimakanibacter lacteus TaxID=2268456 RepID=UPI000E66F9A6
MASRPFIRFAVLIFPGFPLMAFSAVIEPLRAANTISGARLYEWIIVGPDEATVTASSGIDVTPHHAAARAPTADYIVVCSGGDADRLIASKPLSWIRRNLRLGAHLGSVADGAFYLARAGLLDDYTCTLHWQSQPAFLEAFPHVRLAREIFVIDRTRFTSAGGIGALDMMIELIGTHHGRELARQVAEWFVHDRIKATADRERLQLRLRTGIRDDLVLKAVAEMEKTPDRADDVSAIAGRLGVSLGQLERLFKAEFGIGPAEHYRRLKMERARDLLGHSKMSVREVGLACGYASFSSFVRAYKAVFGATPGRARKS